MHSIFLSIDFYSLTRHNNLAITQSCLVVSCVLQKKTNMNLFVYFFCLFSTLIALYLSFGDAGKNSSSGAISGNTGEKSDPCREKAEGGIHNEVTLRFREKGSHPWNEHPRFLLSLPSCPALHPYTHLPGLLSEICQNTFHTNRYFSAFKASFDLLDKPKQLKFCEISKASQASLFFFFLQTTLNTPLPVL